MKTVLVACGTAIATSTVVASAIEEAAKKAGIPIHVKQCKVTEIPSQVAGADLIVTTTQISQDYGVPVIQGLPFLTGIGKDKALEEILDALRD